LPSLPSTLTFDYKRTTHPSRDFLPVFSVLFFCSFVGAAAPAGGAAAPAASSAEVAPQVAAFDEFSAPTLKAFAEACATIGGPDAAACNELVVSAWSAQRNFLVMASQCKKPAKPEDMMTLMKQCGVVDACQAAGKVGKKAPYMGVYAFIYGMVLAQNFAYVGIRVYINAVCFFEFEINFFVFRSHVNVCAQYDDPPKQACLYLLLQLS